MSTLIEALLRGKEAEGAILVLVLMIFTVETAAHSSLLSIIFGGFWLASVCVCLFHSLREK